MIQLILGLTLILTACTTETVTDLNITEMKCYNTCQRKHKPALMSDIGCFCGDLKDYLKKVRPKEYRRRYGKSNTN